MPLSFYRSAFWVDASCLEGGIGSERERRSEAWESMCFGRSAQEGMQACVVELNCGNPDASPLESTTPNLS